MNCLSYESVGHKSDVERELNQSQLIHDIIKSKKIEKAIIYCGFGHGLEEVPKPNITMCSNLKKLLNQDILSIDQTNYSYALKEYQIPIVDESIKIKGFDLVVDHPKLNRNSWTRYDPSLRSFKINKPKIIKYPCTVYVYDSDSFNNSIPLDALNLNGESNERLILPTGQYHTVFVDQTRIISQKIILE